MSEILRNAASSGVSCVCSNLIVLPVVSKLQHESHDWWPWFCYAMDRVVFVRLSQGEYITLSRLLCDTVLDHNFSTFTASTAIMPRGCELKASAIGDIAYLA